MKKSEPSYGQEGKMMTLLESGQFPKRLNIELPHDPESLFFNTYPREMKIDASIKKKIDVLTYIHSSINK